MIVMMILIYDHFLNKTCKITMCNTIEISIMFYIRMWARDYIYEHALYTCSAEKNNGIKTHDSESRGQEEAQQCDH